MLAPWPWGDIADTLHRVGLRSAVVAVLYSTVHLFTWLVSWCGSNASFLFSVPVFVSNLRESSAY